jgi:hypothetical protein
MQPPLPSFLKFEMFDYIGDIEIRPVDRSVDQRPIENAARRPHERVSLEIFVIPRLLPDQSDPGRLWPVTKNGLRRLEIKIAPLAASRGRAKMRQGSTLRKK